MACTSGLCSGTRHTAVPSLMRVVVAEAMASPMNGSPMSAMKGGIEPSGVPPYLEVVCTGMMGCSGSQKESKPASSAFCANSATFIELLLITVLTPIFISSPFANY